MIGGTNIPHAGSASGCAGRVSRTWRQEEQGGFLRLLALANETADELLSRPACGIRLTGGRALVRAMLATAKERRDLQLSVGLMLAHLLFHAPLSTLA